MQQAVHVVLWIFVGAICVLIVKNASGFATAVNAVGGQVTDDASLLAGYAPNTGSGSQKASAQGASVVSV